MKGSSENIHKKFEATFERSVLNGNIQDVIQICQVSEILHSELILLLHWTIEERLQVGILKGYSELDLIQSPFERLCTLIDLCK